jgi:hypothetical protein
VNPIGEQLDRRRQSAEAKGFSWSRIKWRDSTDLGKRLDQLVKEDLPALRGVTLKAAHALVQFQGRHWGAVIADGQKIAQACDIGESTWWEIARPALEGHGFICTVERGGGRMPGGNGRANVYMAPGAGAEPVPPKAPRSSTNVDDQGNPRAPLASHIGDPPSRKGREPPHT